MTAIFTEGLTKYFGKTAAVKNLNIKVKKGEIFGLIGPDGAGKTTTMRMLSAILDPTEGSATILDHSVTQEGEAIKGLMGYMSQRFGLYPDLSVEENIDFYADIYNVHSEERRVRTKELLEMYGLLQFKDRLAGNLSGGMKQKLGLACALIHSPELVLLDEPTNGVDPLSRREFWNSLKQLQGKGMTILMTTSYLEEAEKCDRIGLIHDGTLYATGTLREIEGLVDEKRVAVRLEEARKQFPLFQAAMKEFSLRLSGSEIHAMTVEVEKAAQLFKKVAEEEKIPIHGIDVTPPRLEDIFISLLSNGS